jgi:hypothetical protein
MRTRVLVGALGIYAMGYGLWRILQQPQLSKPPELLRWLIGAVVLHDGVLVPATLVVGAALTVMRPRARRYVQGALVAGALVTAVAIPLIYRHGSQPTAKSLENQNYAAHLTLILGLIGACAALAYTVRVVRDRRDQRISVTKVRPPASQTSEEV